MTANLAADLERDVIFGVLPPGTRLTEDRVMAQHAATRHAVRSAFASLEGRGLLVHRPNRGVEVVSYTPDEIDALYEVRIVLETGAAARTALPVAPEITAEMRRIAAAHRDAVAAQDVEAVYDLNQTFHRVQFSCCGNARLSDLIEEHARLAQPIRVVKYDDTDHMAAVVAQHFDIIARMEGRSVEAYVAATRDHLPASAIAYRAQHDRRAGRRAGRRTVRG